MTEQKFFSIYSKLKKWREDRHLTIEAQRAGLIANITEELTEYKRATTDYDRIDALCDMAVFLINTLDENTEEAVRTYYNQEIERFKISRVEFVGLISYGYTPLVQVISDQERDYYSVDEWDWERVAFDIAVFIILIENMIEQYDIPFLSALDETIKEINSREGEYDDSQKKFIKFLGAYTREEALALLKDNDDILSETETCWNYGTPNTMKMKVGETGRMELIGATIKQIKGKIIKWYKADYFKLKEN